MLTLLSLILVSQTAVWNNGTRINPQAIRLNLNGDVSCARYGSEVTCGFTNPATDGGKVREAYVADASITAQSFDHTPGGCAFVTGQLAYGIAANGDLSCRDTPKVAEAYMADASITAQMLDHDPADCDITKREYGMGITANGLAVCAVHPIPLTCAANQYLTYLNVSTNGTVSSCSALPDPGACSAGSYYSDLTAAGVSTCTTLPTADSTTNGVLKMLGDLSGTGASPQVVDDSHNHGTTTIAALDTSDTTTGTWPAARGGLGAAQPTCAADSYFTCNGTTCSCPAQTAWTNATYGTGFVSFGAGWHAAGYWKDPNGNVHLRGFMKRTSGTGTVLFTLPAGYRPANQMELPGVSNSIFALIEITTAGVVQCSAAGITTSISVEGIVFDTR